MPRGNLETIHPRAMVLASVAEQLDRSDLTDPMDMAPEAASKSTSKQATTSSLNTVNEICEAMIAHLTKLDEQTYLHTILISYIRKSPTDIVGALSVIHQLQRTNAMAPSERKAMTDQQLGEAIKFISVMVDFKRLYDEALGMYDFMLVLLVIQNSHLDPREHIPFLNELRALPLAYRHFRIDDHLGRHVKAMTNLWSAAYVVKHQLYAPACEVAASNPSKLRLIHKAHAEYLKEQKDIIGAGQAYQLAREFEPAIECYLEANQWRAMFTIAHQQSYTRAQLAALARTAIDNLSNERRYADAAIVADEYLQDAEMTVSLLVEAGQWMEAGRKARACNRGDLIETCILAGLEEGADRLLEDMEMAEAQLDKQYPRLLELRKEFLSRPAEIDEHNVLLDDVEIQSSSTALTSQFSRFTLTTATHSTR
ncbi:IKI3 family-domain-containing protein [Syncephalis pseudoplumigaleata]|uniref:IKI3 family-domain-containing protein n=1 Tax=Syncephalis pseudoplumigaleata TaxID=1712513 RepID=A0A4P9YT23_9FUNG|nr:IKI3 family-domain-containing protein [Syncephalis pseudoplumigaleata]|eukprot:RKP22905.1 IKI3 family-domain-containing protein [Syncephalis pseudoplumigaleata]